MKLPLILGTVTGLILLFVTISIVSMHHPEIHNLPVPPTTPLPPVKTPIDECAHNHKDQTLDSGILCLPNDTKLIKNYNGAPII
jgi:hypothetical protein